jgi:carboxylesterase
VTSSSSPTAPFHAPVPGAEVGVLLVHGFTGSPASMRPWAEDLHARGYSVSLPRLPGHGTRWQDLQATTYDDWYAEADNAFAKLKAEHDRVVVCGMSMGGLIGLDLALHHGRDLAGLVVVNPAVSTTRKDVKLLPVLKHVVPAFPAIGNDIKRPGQDEHAYPRTPLKAAASMFTEMRRVRERLADVTQPLLMLRSRVDHVLDPSSGRTLMARVSSRDLEEVVLEESYHVATLDNDAPLIFDRSASFVARVTS